LYVAPILPLNYYINLLKINSNIKQKVSEQIIKQATTLFFSSISLTLKHRVVALITPIILT